MNTPTLTERAQQIATATLDALQAADEMGGCETTAEYVALMDFVQREIAHRKSVSLAARAAEGPLRDDENILAELASYGGAVLYWQLSARDNQRYHDASLRRVINFNGHDDCYSHPRAIVLGDGAYKMP